MKPELENQIVAIYPEIFRYPDWKDIRFSLISFGFECGDGWFELLKELVTKIKEIDYDKSTQVTQIKEKFGILCFYTNVSTIEVDKLIREYEAKSAKICESCGADATKKTRGWISNLCETCYDKRTQAS